VDGQRFDDLTRALARNASRRGLLKASFASFAALAAGVAPRLGLHRVAGQDTTANCVLFIGNACDDANPCGVNCTTVDCCGGVCADLTADPGNCSECGRACDTGFCVSGVCCPAGNLFCDGNCIDGTADPAKLRRLRRRVRTGAVVPWRRLRMRVASDPLRRRMHRSDRGPRQLRRVRGHLRGGAIMLRGGRAFRSKPMRPIAAPAAPSALTAPLSVVAGAASISPAIRPTAASAEPPADRTSAAKMAPAWVRPQPTPPRPAALTGRRPAAISASIGRTTRAIAAVAGRLARPMRSVRAASASPLSRPPPPRLHHRVHARSCTMARAGP
jgi:hypothetical protein